MTTPQLQLGNVRTDPGIAAAQECGVKFGRQAGQRVKADRYEARVLKLRAEGKSYREIAVELRLSKNTVMGIVKRQRDQDDLKK
ncbi:helix-turn-helix domain-containing protein [Deinococcus radiopugnans]|nr:helix-turn-helix domain-containing protein [Deinococcus radiopugnans]